MTVKYAETRKNRKLTEWSEENVVLEKKSKNKRN